MNPCKSFHKEDSSDSESGNWAVASVETGAGARRAVQELQGTGRTPHMTLTSHRSEVYS